MTNMNMGRLARGSLPNVQGVTAHGMTVGLATQGAVANVVAEHPRRGIMDFLFGRESRQ